MTSRSAILCCAVAMMAMAASCIAHPPAAQTPTIEIATYTLPASADDGDRFCVQAWRAVPPTLVCSSVGEIRAIMIGLKKAEN